MVLMVMGIIINPLFGRFRFRTGEMVLVSVVMLSIAGFTSSVSCGCIPTWSPSEALPSKPAYEIFSAGTGRE